jgi:hypothetical protein
VAESLTDELPQARPVTRPLIDRSACLLRLRPVVRRGDASKSAFERLPVGAQHRKGGAALPCSVELWRYA